MAACFKACVACPLSTQESAGSRAFLLGCLPHLQQCLWCVCHPLGPWPSFLLHLFTQSQAGWRNWNPLPLLHICYYSHQNHMQIWTETQMNAVCVIMRTGLFPWAFIVIFPYKNSYYVKIGEDSDYYFAWALPAYVTDRAKLTFYFIRS